VKKASRHQGIEASRKRRGRQEEGNIRRLRRFRRFIQRNFKRKGRKRRSFTQRAQRHGERQKNKKKVGKHSQIAQIF